jgi:hypothetical protein
MSTTEEKPCIIEGKIARKLKLKDGRVFPIGTYINVQKHPDNNQLARCVLASDHITSPVNPVKLRYSTLSTLLPEQFPPITDEEMESGALEGEIESVVGGRCYEMDGYDEDGWPSKFMAHGFI